MFLGSGCAPNDFILCLWCWLHSADHLLLIQFKYLDDEPAAARLGGGAG